MKTTTSLAAALLLLAGADAAIPAGGVPKVSPHSAVSSFQFPVSTFPVPISPGSDAMHAASLPIGLLMGAVSRHRHEVPSFHHHTLPYSHLSSTARTKKKSRSTAFCTL